LVVNALALPAPLRDTLGDSASEGLVQMFEGASTLAAERYERRLAEETGRIRLEIAELKFELIKWMFLFWIGQVAVNIAAVQFLG
jgi:hypothetical protein